MVQRRSCVVVVVRSRLSSLRFLLEGGFRVVGTGTSATFLLCCVNLFFLRGRRGVALASMLESSGRRPRRACVRSVPGVPVRVDRAPTLAPDVARSLRDLTQWFNSFHFCWH